MKLCAACGQGLPKERFSKKQWQSNQRQRRCKDCIAANREVQPVPPPACPKAKSEAAPEEKDASLLPRVVGEGALCLTDDDLFKQPPPMPDCPICFLPMMLNSNDSSSKCYYPCCGKTICTGCSVVFVKEGGDRCICPFCRAPEETSNESAIERMKKRVDAGDAETMHHLGVLYEGGGRGLRGDPRRASDLWLRAGALGCAASNGRIGTKSCMEGDMRKAERYWELAAMGGDVASRYNLAVLEKQRGRARKAIRHLLVSAGAGHDESMSLIRSGFLAGDVTKDDFSKALRAHKDSKDRMRSDQREEAAVWEAQIDM